MGLILHLKKWGDFLNLLENFQKIYSDKKKLYIFLVLGIIILMSGNLFTKDKITQSDTNESIVNNEDVSREEKRLEKILSHINGAGKTSVMITRDTGVEKVLAQNIKINKTAAGDRKDTGGENTETELAEVRETVMSGSGSSQMPFVTREIFPKIRGVLVVAEGAGNEQIRYNIKNAVAAVLDVPYYKIQVLEKAK